MISSCITFTQLLRVWLVKHRLEPRSRQYSMDAKELLRIFVILYGTLISLTPSPNSREQHETVFESEDNGTCSMEAWIMISCFALCATDHARSSEPIDGGSSVSENADSLWRLSWKWRRQYSLIKPWVIEVSSSIRLCSGFSIKIKKMGSIQWDLVGRIQKNNYRKISPLAHP